MSYKVHTPSTFKDNASRAHTCVFLDKLNFKYSETPLLRTP